MKKIFLYSAILVFILVSVCGCMSYKRVGISGNEPFVNQQVKDNFENYNVYVHDGYNTYRVQNPSVSGNVITGKPVRVASAEEIKAIKEAAKVKGKDKHKYDLNIYTKKPLYATEDTLNGQDDKLYAVHDSDLHTADPGQGTDANKLELKADDIEKIEMFAGDEKSVGLIVLFVVLGVLLIGLIVWGLIIVAKEGSDGSADASGASSGNSSAASNSNSSGGGGGGSCYIATMVYGSYDAPEVLVLRGFRDNVLENFYLGRKFISVYYKYSPWFVEKFRHNDVVHKPIRFLLNWFVNFLSR